VKSVEITVRGKHFDVPESAEQHARRKLSKLDHYLPLLSDAQVEVDIAHQRAKEPHERYLVRVLVSGKGVRLRAEERGEDIKPALDRAARTVIDQARKQKERLYGRTKARTAKGTRRPSQANGRPGAPAWQELARVKRFAPERMTVREAADEMNALGHSFFLYHDAEEDRLAVLYRRKGGDYGVILPEPS
jgi:putative sigma-54 modulation protein